MWSWLDSWKIVVIPSVQIDKYSGRKYIHLSGQVNRRRKHSARPPGGRKRVGDGLPGTEVPGNERAPCGRGKYDVPAINGGSKGARAINGPQVCRGACASSRKDVLPVC